MWLMKHKQILLIILMFICCFNGLGQAKDKALQNKTEVTIQQLQTDVTNTQDHIQQLQKDNQELQKLLQSMEKEIDLYREDVRSAISEMNSNMGHWLEMLTIVMALISIFIPLFINSCSPKELFPKSPLAIIT